MTDDEFLRAFENATLPAEAFRHRDHLRMAYLYMRQGGVDSAAAKIREGIRAFAVAKGATALYHETITRFWVKATGAATAGSGVDTFEDLLDMHPKLADKELPYRHWSRERLASSDARERWVEPDLRPLPF
jgi:hypothetical protein